MQFHNQERQLISLCETQKCRVRSKNVMQLERQTDTPALEQHALAVSQSIKQREANHAYSTRQASLALTDAARSYERVNHQ